MIGWFRYKVEPLMNELISARRLPAIRCFLSLLAFGRLIFLEPEATAQTVTHMGGTLSETFDGVGALGTTTPAGWFVGWAGGTVTFSTNITVNDGSLAPNQNAGWNF